MKEYIECRSCDSSYCNGCNIHTLATMLREGKFDSLMDDKHSIKPYADVVERKRGEWESYISKLGSYVYYRCTVCGEPNPYQHTNRAFSNFCPNCGADMREGQT